LDKVHQTRRLASKKLAFLVANRHSLERFCEAKAYQVKNEPKGSIFYLGSEKERRPKVGDYNLISKIAHFWAFFRKKLSPDL